MDGNRASRLVLFFSVVTVLTLSFVIGGALEGSAAILAPRSDRALGIAPAIVPANILHSVAIIISNDQPSPTSFPFQQMLSIDSSAFSAWEASNLQNVKFFYSDGTTIPSWLESGNANTATNTVYWLNIANGIPAHSSITIFMGFASPTTNLFDIQTTGEAPELSLSYGGNDDGSRVFTFYDGFLGTSYNSLSWSVYGGAGAPNVNNGLTSVNGQGLASKSTFGSTTTVIDASYYLSSSTCNAFVPGGNFGGGCGLVTLGCIGCGPGFGVTTLGNGGYQLQNDSPAGTAGVGISASTTAYSVFTFYGTASQSAVSVNYAMPTTLGTDYVGPFNGQIIIGGNSGYSYTFYLHWVRARAYPPNGVMPSATIAPPLGDFGITATTPGSVAPSEFATSTITVTAENGFSGTVGLSITPSSGLACSAITPSSITTSGAATVSCNAAAAGTYTAIVTGTSGATSHTAVITIVVNPPPTPVAPQPTIFGLSPLLFYALIATIVVIVVIVLVALVVLRRRKTVR